MDIAATIARLRDAGANTYAYLISPRSTRNPLVSQVQWEDLARFAPRALEAGIDVYVYLVPPTETDEASYRPFQWDYLRWAEAIGQLAAEHQSIRGIIIDDFGANASRQPSQEKVFTPEYLSNMMSFAHQYADWLQLLPVLYYHDIAGKDAILRDFRGVIDGVVFPYFGNDASHVPGNTIDASLALEQGRRVASLSKCPATSTCRQIIFPAKTGTIPRTDAWSVVKTLMPSAATRRELKFRLTDDRAVDSDADYYVQVLIDGRPEPALQPVANGWGQYVFDLTAATQPGVAVTCEFRVVRRGSEIRASAAIAIDRLVWSGFNSTGTGTSIRSSEGVQTTPFEELPVVFMTYASPLGWEAGNGASPAYVKNVLVAVDQLRKDKLIEGSMVYSLNIEGRKGGGDPASFEVVRDRYMAWQRNG